ncbi:MAG: type II toxin-antitoxin system Phd/YefM family antitoxin [Streptosporangiaceae bacterium]
MAAAARSWYGCSRRSARNGTTAACGTTSSTTRSTDGHHRQRGAQDPVPFIEQVNNDRIPVEINSRRGDAVLISRADYEALEETAHLLRSPANGRRLLESLAQAQRGDRKEHPLDR